MLAGLYAHAMLFGILAAPLAAAAETPSTVGTAIEKAIASLRKVDPSVVAQADRNAAKWQELVEARMRLTAAGKAAADRCKEEIRKIDAAGEKDDFFKLAAASVFWHTGGLDEVPTIAGIWAGNTLLDADYADVFFTALDAAKIQDARAVPMLAVLLKDKKGSVSLPRSSLTLSWPLTQDLLWCAFGPQGLPELARLLESSGDGPTMEFAAMFLAKAEYLPALPAVRRLAREGKGCPRACAVQALGVLGHPDDYEFLVAGLKSDDPKLLWSFVYALYEYEDLRAVPQVVPLLGSKDPAVRQEAIDCLAYLLTPESLESLRNHSQFAEDTKERDACAGTVAQAMKACGLSWEEYSSKPPAAKRALMASLRQRAEEKYVLKEYDRRLTHDEFVKAAAEWQKNQRMSRGFYHWVKEQHVLAVATPADLDLLLQVRARVCQRLSDGCLEEKEVLDDLIQRIGRSRYRKVVGLTEKVEPPGPAAN